MKIKKLPNTKKVIVEFDEFLDNSEPTIITTSRRGNTIEKMNELSHRRTAYNMWEFKTENDALQALFILGLKE